MAGSITYTCKVCGAPHGGVYHPDICHNCWAKGHRPRYFGIRAKR